MVWSKAKGCYVVVSELAKQNGKNKYGQTGDTTGLLSALLCALMLTGSALFWPMEVSAGTQYGDGTWADGYNTAIGIAATARGDGALALGTQTKATSIRSTAIGHQAEASGADSISIGTLSGASNPHSIAIGNKARAYGVDAIAFGSSANATATNAMAMGLNARTTASGSVAVGVNTEVTQINSVAMGATAKTYGDSAASLGVDVVSRGHSAVAVGANARALAQSAVSLGDSTYADALSAVSVGVSSRATAVRALAVGDSARATAEDTVAIGGAAKANATGAVAIGKDALANQEAGTAVGIAAEATGQYAAAFGDAAKASVRWGTAIGTGSLANVAAGAVGYDPSGAFHSGDTTGTWKATLGAVAVGDTTRNKTRQIIGVAAGTNDTDAVNVAQLKAAQLGGGGDSSWVIQDTNSPQGRKTIDKNNPLTVRGDRYIKAEVGYDGLNLKLDENQLNNSISNNSTVQNNRTDINNLKSGFNLKAGSATSQVRLGEGTTPTIEFATADDTMTVNLSDKKVTYGIDKNKLVKNITGDLITNINNSTTTPITNIKAQFGVTADSGSQKTVTLTKNTTPTVKFKGDGKYLTSVTDTDGVQYSVDENKLNQNITNITNEAIKGKGLYFGANSGATVLNKLGSTVKIQGEGTKADSEYSGKNVKTKVSQDASGNTIIDVMLDKELSADKVIVGKAGADGKDGVIGVNGKDGVSGVGINGKDGISVKGDKGEVGINGNDGISIKGKDGKDAVTINGKDGVPGVDGKEGHIGLNGKDGITDIWTRPGQPGLNGANGTTMTRVVYKDPKGNEHEVATLDDGLKFAGDDGQTDKSKVIAKLLNKTMDIVGGADNTKLTDGNIGVNNVNGKLQVQLASALNGITSISNGKAGSNNTTITLGDGTVNVGGSTISNVKSALNGTALANASEDQKKSAATIGDLKDAVNNMSGDVNWVIQDANTPKGTKTINSTTPLTVKGDKYVKTTVNNDGLNLGLDEDQLNNTITNNNTVQNNKTDISNLKSGFNLKAGATTSQVKLGEATRPTIEFATADDTMTVNLSDKKVTYGIDKNKLINNINNTTNNPVTNIKAQFGVTADSGSQKTVTLTKDTTPTVKFKGDGKYLTSVTDTDGVQYSVDENKLNQNITNITNEAIKGKGLYFGANSGATVLNKLGSTVKIQGEGTKADSEYSGKNVKTKVSQDASGNTIIDVMLDKELSADKVIVGKAGADGKDGVIGVNGKDGVSGVGINGKDGISVKGDKGEVGINGNDGISIKGKDGKDAVTINGKDGVPGVDGKEGHIGLNGKDGITDIWTRPGQPGLNGANGTTMTRVVYKDPKGNEHEVATLDDGLKFAGDDGQTDKSKVIAKLLNKTMDIVGGADNTKLTDGNIGVNNVNGKLQVQLASALNGITSISNGKAGSNNTTITLGDGTVNVGGSTISNVKSALNGTALANASEDQKKSAATIGDLKDAVNNATLGKGLYFGANSGATVLNKLESTVKIQGEGTKADSEYSGQNVKTKISQDANGNTVIDLMLAKKAVFDSVTTGNTIIDNRGLTVGGTTYVSDSGLNAGGKKITNVADGTDPHDAVNVSQLNKVVAGATTKVADGKNTTVTSETNTNGSKTYHVNLNDDITLGTDSSKQISIKGTEGTIKAGKVTVDGSKGTVNGLTNLTWDPNHFTSGQAATEDQLKAVAGQITKAAKQSSVSAGKNITVTKGTNADGGVDYKVATADDLNLNSVTTGTTVINDKGLTVGGTTYVSKDGLNAGGKKIINVAPGELSKNSTDAVNGSQLYQTNEALNKIGGTINNMDNRINRVGAGAAALAALHPLDFDPDSKWDFAAGYGNYKGANAVAVGAYYRPNEDTMISVGGSMGGGQNMINAGVSLKIGRGNHVSTSRVAMAKEIKDLRAELENMKGALMKVSEGRPLDSLDMDKMQLFPDVPANHWAYDYVATLAGNGVIVGYPDGQFGGDRMMTRYEMAALIYRAMQNGAAADDRMARALKEFEPELERIRVDTITKHKDGTPDIQRVRVIKGRG